MHKIGLYADHAGFELKSEFLDFFKDSYAISDFGTFSLDSVHYPDYAKQAAEAIKNKTIDRAVLICGTGIGMSIAANRFPWVRAFVAHDEMETRLARAHNDVNIICFSGRFPVDFKMLFKIFMETPFEGGRHQQRLDMFGANSLEC